MGGRGGSSNINSINNALDKLNALERKSMGAVATPIPRVDRSTGQDLQNIWQGLSNRQRQSLPEETVPISEVRTWQTWVNKDGIQRILEGRNTEHHTSDASSISAVFYNGNYVLMDGNHRVAAMILQDQKTVRLRVYRA